MACNASYLKRECERILLLRMLILLERAKRVCISKETQASDKVDRHTDQSSTVDAKEIARVRHLEFNVVRHESDTYAWGARSIFVFLFFLLLRIRADRPFGIRVAAAAEAAPEDAVEDV